MLNNSYSENREQNNKFVDIRGERQDQIPNNLASGEREIVLHLF